MLGGKGFHRGSSILITGTAGTGKSSFSAAFVDAACQRGERCLYFAFEKLKARLFGICARSALTWHRTSKKDCSNSMSPVPPSMVLKCTW